MFEVFKSDWCPLTFYFKGDSFDIIDFNQRIIYFMEYLISVIKDPRKNSSVLLTLVFFLLLKSGLHEFSSKNKRVEPFKVINQSV